MPQAPVGMTVRSYKQCLYLSLTAQHIVCMLPEFTFLRVHYCFSACVYKSMLT